MRSTWDFAQLALILLQIEPHGLGGIWLKSRFSPARQSWLAQLEGLGLALKRMPHHIDPERMLGGIDLPLTLAKGRLSEHVGLLAQADQGLVVVSMSEKLEPHTLAMLVQSQDEGRVDALEQGQSHNARFGLVALDESLDDEQGAASKLKERLAIWIDISAVDLAESQHRVEPLNPGELARVRTNLARLEPTESQVRAVCEVAHALGVESLRVPILALRLACRHAALHDRPTLEDEDLAVATQMVLSGRATRWPQNLESLPATETETPEATDREPSNEPCHETDAAANTMPETEQLKDTLIAAALATLPARLLDQLEMGNAKTVLQSNSGSSGQARQSCQRGSPLAPMPGRPGKGARLHVLATLRAAAPKQKLRKLQGGQKIAIRIEDFHVQRFAHKAATCLIVAMDASGSSALARLAEAKGAVEILLQQSYARRDSICVIAFRGTQAQTLLPATRSLVRAKKALAGLPGGGGTPIATAIRLAIEQALALKRLGITPLLVMLSDGKANVTLNGLGGRMQAHADALLWAQQWAQTGLASLWIDTALQPTGQAQALAAAMHSRYLPMPHLASQRLADAMQFARTS
jgi:magnesium chelatase subunit D